MNPINFGGIREYKGFAFHLALNFLSFPDPCQMSAEKWP